MFEEKVHVDKSVKLSWDNTIAFDMDEDFRWLYCVTDGMGIQFDKAAYLEEQDNEIKSRYVMTLVESNVYKRMNNDGYIKIIETSDFVVFKMQGKGMRVSDKLCY